MIVAVLVGVAVGVLIGVCVGVSVGVCVGVSVAPVLMHEPPDGVDPAGQLVQSLAEPPLQVKQLLSHGRQTVSVTAVHGKA